MIYIRQIQIELKNQYLKGQTNIGEISIPFNCFRSVWPLNSDLTGRC